MKEFNFEYKITAEDYITHQLFEASRNSEVKKHRKRGLILWLIAFFLMALVFWFQENKYLALYFVIFGIAFIFIYPVYSRWIYKRYYTRYIRRMLKNREGEEMSVKLKQNEIRISNGMNEGVIDNDDILEITEIPTHIFIKLKEGRNVILPKNKIQNLEELKEIVELISEHNRVTHHKVSTWVWK